MEPMIDVSATPSSWMEDAVRLAERGLHEVEPNPPVGALVLRDGKVVGRGHHAFYGGPHAEIQALEEAGPLAAGSTLVVTLEPCCTRGKTPPCTAAILERGVARVIVGAVDPNPRHQGSGVRALVEGGVQVDVPVAEDLVSPLLGRFRRHLLTDRPYVVAKWAMTIDGRVASRTGDSRWISGEESRQLVHRLRGRVDGIAVGVGTVLADDPRLTVRSAGDPGPLSPVRIIFDRTLRTPMTWRALHEPGPDILIVHDDTASPERGEALARTSARLLRAEGEGSTAFLHAALRKLRDQGVERLLVEGGPTLLGGFHEARVIDQVLVFVAARIVGGQEAPGAVGALGRESIAGCPPLEAVRWSVVGNDVVLQAHMPA